MSPSVGHGASLHRLQTDWTGSPAMIRIPRVSISMRELDRLKCIQGLIDKQIKQEAVAERLGLTTRQVRRLARRYAAGGPVGLVGGPGHQDPKVNVRGFWADSGYREAQNQARYRFGHGDRATAADCRRSLDSKEASAAEGSAAAHETGVRWRTYPNRRLRTSLV